MLKLSEKTEIQTVTEMIDYINSSDYNLYSVKWRPGNYCMVDSNSKEGSAVAKTPTVN